MWWTTNIGQLRVFSQTSRAGADEKRHWEYLKSIKHLPKIELRNQDNKTTLINRRRAWTLE